MKPRVAIILMKKRFHFFYQLQNLLGKYIDFSNYALEEGISSYINCDLALTPSNEAVAYIRRYLMPSTEILVVRRTISREAWQKIREIPANIRVLVVSTYLEMALQIIAVLYELGFYQFEFVPYDPNSTENNLYEGIEYAITPAEVPLVPPSIKYIVDIGIRLVDISTLFDILNKLNLVNEDTRQLLVGHMQDMVPLSPGFVKVFNQFYEADEQLTPLMNMMNCGCITFDMDNRIKSYNKAVENFFDGKVKLEVELPLERIFSYFTANKNLATDTITNELIQLEHVDYWINKKPLFEKGVCIGGILTLRPRDDLDTSGKRFYQDGKGHRAKHVFSDILGNHDQLCKVIGLAKKAATTHNDILIEGESGVGKELFAQAIHNASLRAKGPFVAFNCAALNETLLESELFGYEEGAFTGAQKKGRQGLFETANHGTIFLDEIAEISKATQAKLLRVLQERELIRVGGNKIIPLDIRVITAANQNLYDLVKAERFRIDLYFRLNVINIRIPSLRQRKEDIPLLIRNILRANHIRKDVPQWLMGKFINYDWPGNIRELKNCLQYMISLHDDFSLEGLPPYIADQLKEDEENNNKPAADCKEEIMVLEILKEAYEENAYAGRQKITKKLHEKKYNISEQRIRTILNQLAAENLICILKGRAGTKITNKGLAFLRAI